MFERNEGTVDRIVRAVLGVGLLWASLAPWAGRKIGIRRFLLAFTGAALGLSAITGHCSLYNLFHITTTGDKR